MKVVVVMVDVDGNVTYELKYINTVQRKTMEVYL